MKRDQRKLLHLYISLKNKCKKKLPRQYSIFYVLETYREIFRFGKKVIRLLQNSVHARIEFRLSWCHLFICDRFCVTLLSSLFCSSVVFFFFFNFLSHFVVGFYPQSNQFLLRCRRKNWCGAVFLFSRQFSCYSLLFKPLFIEHFRLSGGTTSRKAEEDEKKKTNWTQKNGMTGNAMNIRASKKEKRNENGWNETASWRRTIMAWKLKQKTAIQNCQRNKK